MAWDFMKWESAKAIDIRCKLVRILIITENGRFSEPVSLVALVKPNERLNDDSRHDSWPQYVIRHRNWYENGPDSPHIVSPAKAGAQGSRGATPGHHYGPYRQAHPSHQLTGESRYPRWGSEVGIPLRSKDCEKSSFSVS